MGLNGEQLRLARGDWEAVVSTAGATLVQLRHAGRDAICSFDPTRGVGGASYMGRVLAPWPNRVTGGRYSFAGREFTLPINEASTGAALHGLAIWSDWRVDARSADGVTLTLTLPGSLGYPFALALSVTYWLTADGLDVTIGAQNIGPETAPVGLGVHPYLTCDNLPIDDCVVTCPASQILSVDEQLAPVGLSGVLGTAYDFTQPTAMRGRSVDHAFTGLSDRGWSVTLSGGGMTVSLRAATPWLQLYSGEEVGRRGLAVEPMTCPPDAFNGPDAATALAPGDRRGLGFTILAE